MKDLTLVINEIQSSNISQEDVPMICKAVQDYYKLMAEVGAIKPAKAVVKKTVKPLSKLNKTDLVAKCEELEIEVNEEDTNKMLADKINNKG